MGRIELLESVGFRVRICRNCKHFISGNENRTHDCGNGKRRNRAIERFGFQVPVTSEEMSCQYWEGKNGY